MSRPARCRRIEKLPLFRSFSPDDVETAESVFMTVDEFEAMRLLDDEGLTQKACALKMNVAWTTVTAIYESARRKVADALVRGQRLLIVGGCCDCVHGLSPFSRSESLPKRSGSGAETRRNALYLRSEISVDCQDCSQCLL